MKFPRAAFCAAVLALAGSADAQDWPSRPIRVLVGFGAGGGTDIIARMVAQPLTEILGQPVVIENKPGAGGSIAADAVAKASPGGNHASATASIEIRTPWKLGPNLATDLAGFAPLKAST